MHRAPAADSAANVVTNFAELVAIDGHSHRLRLPGGAMVEARRAVGCLAEPVVGDRVLASGDPGNDEWYVLAVLDRDQAAPVTLSAEHDLTIASRHGDVRLIAAEDVECAAGRAFRVAAPELTVEAREGRVGISVLEYVGEGVRAQLERVRVVAQIVETRAERISQHVDRCIRFVREIDLLRAKQVDHHAEDTLHLRARHAIITANQVVKIDGDQVQLG